MEALLIQVEIDADTIVALDIVVPSHCNEQFHMMSYNLPISETVVPVGKL